MRIRIYNTGNKYRTVFNKYSAVYLERKLVDSVDQVFIQKITILVLLDWGVEKAGTVL